MAIYHKVNGTHKEMTNLKVKVAGAWKQAVREFTKVGGVWKSVWAVLKKVRIYNGQSFNVPISNFSDKATSATLKGVKIRLIEQSSGTVYNENDIGDCALNFNDTSPLALTVSYQSSYNCAFYIYTNDSTYPNARIECSVYPGNAAAYFMGEIEYTYCVAK